MKRSILKTILLSFFCQFDAPKVKTRHFLRKINFWLTIWNYLWRNKWNQSIVQLDYHYGGSSDKW